MKSSINTVEGEVWTRCCYYNCLQFRFAGPIFYNTNRTYEEAKQDCFDKDRILTTVVYIDYTNSDDVITGNTYWIGYNKFEFYSWGEGNT